MKQAPRDIDASMLRDWVEPQVSGRRFQHIVNVVELAKDLAARSSLDVRQAELAAWLHDACKEKKDSWLVDKARSFGLQVSELEERHGHILHGPVAAEVARVELGITEEAILKAVAQHTLGEAPMEPLSEILYLADALEESRPEEFKGPIRRALRLDDSGPLDRNRAILVAADLTLLHLIDSERFIHPKAVEVRNCYLARCRP